MIKKITAIISIFLPWVIKRRLLSKVLGYELHPTAHIGYSFVFTKMLIMKENTSIGDLTVCKGLDLLEMNESSSIGKGNWITGFPSGHPIHFNHQKDRVPQLKLGAHSAITNRHIIDCTNSVLIGKFATFAGFRSQILTHSIDLLENRQSSKPIKIGEYSFVGTDSVIIGGSQLPNYSLLSAKSLLNKAYKEEYMLYGGIPAKPIRKISMEHKYFNRKKGSVS